MSTQLAREINKENSNISNTNYCFLIDLRQCFNCSRESFEEYKRELLYIRNYNNKRIYTTHMG